MIAGGATGRQKPRIFYGWWVVAGSVVGVSVGSAQFAFGSLGLFITPFGTEFGWSRTAISVALTIFTVAQALAAPVIGHLIDRFGARRVLLPSLLIYAILLASIPVLLAHLWQLFLIFFLIGSLATGAGFIPYVRTISAWFDRRRGLALGVTMAGGGLGFVYVPPFVQYFIDTSGWRAGYYGLVCIIMLAFPVIYVLFRESPADMGLSRDGQEAAAVTVDSVEVPGLTRAAAIRGRTFWLLFLVFAMLAFCLFGVFPHLVPMLTDRGMSGAHAALVAATLGFSMVGARAGVGYLLDRYFAPYVAVPCFILSALGLGLLATGASGWPAFVAAALIGLSAGAEFDLLAFLTSRYFGLRSFGEIYGLLFVAFLIGTSLGPIAYGAIFDLTGAYFWILAICTVIVVIAGVVMAFMPRYPALTRQE